MYFDLKNGWQETKKMLTLVKLRNNVGTVSIECLDLIHK